MNAPEPMRRDDLLADAALLWLEPHDQADFAAVVRDAAGAAEHAEYARVAALAATACGESALRLEREQALALHARLLADARTFFAAGPRPVAALPRTGRPHGVRWLPWLVAAAGWLLWALPAREPSAAAARAALLSAHPDVLTCAWQPGPSARGAVGGDVVWDASTQQGFLRLRGLPPLEPSLRYQLWIVDERRQGPPVDGGLLQLPASDGEVIVRVASRLPVARAAAFVLTVERAEGAVVSAQEQVVAIAKP